MLKIFIYNIKGDTKKPSTQAHQLLETLLAKELQEEIQNLHFAKHPQGKPYLCSHPHIHFNLSHSFDYIVIAISDAPIGIDIEKIRNRNYQAILSRYFAPEEQAYILSLPLNQQAASFIQLWTLKESFLKYKGCGIANNIQNYPIEIKNENNRIQVKNYSEESVFFHTQLLHSEYYISICTPKKNMPFFFDNTQK